VVPVTLRIASKKFEQVLDVNLAEGNHLKLSIEPGHGFQIKQQTKSFSYKPGKLNTKEVGRLSLSFFPSFLSLSLSVCVSVSVFLSFSFFRSSHFLYIVPALQVKKEKVPSITRGPSGGLVRTSGGVGTSSMTSNSTSPRPSAQQQPTSPRHEVVTSAPVKEELAGKFYLCANRIVTLLTICPTTANDAAYAAEEEARLAKIFGKRGYGNLTKEN